MQKFSRILAGIAIVAGVVLLGLAIGWFGSKTTVPPAEPLPTNTAAVTPTPPQPAAPRSTRDPVTPPRSGPDGSIPGPVTPAVNSASAGAITNWEDRLDVILGSDSDETNKIAELYSMFPLLGEEGQTEVAQHLSNLVPDEDYKPLANLLTNATLPEPVLDVLIADLLNRPNADKLPTLLVIGSNPQHSKGEEARDLLELYLDEDYGTDWATWQKKIDEWLKENPD